TSTALTKRTLPRDVPSNACVAPNLQTLPPTRPTTPFLSVPPRPPRSTLFPYTTLFRSVRDPGEQHEPHQSEPQRDGGLLHRRFLPLSNLRLHRQTERPRRTSRMVAAASSAVSSSSSCMTSANASSDVRRSSAASAALTMRCRTSRDAPTIA